jgi:hypothetical protein
MRIIETTSRLFREKQKDFFDMADHGEKIIIKRGKKQAYVLTPISDDDLYFSPKMIKRIKNSVKEVKEGKFKTFNSIEDLENHLGSL